MNDDLSSTTPAESGTATAAPCGAVSSGTPHTEVTLALADWLEHCPYAETLAREAVCEAFIKVVPADNAAGLPLVVVDVLLADNARLAELNAKWRDREGPTNVLSFTQMDAPLEALGIMTADGPPVLLGDIAVAFETVRDEASSQGKRFDHHLTHLMVHGTLHLLGFDHQDSGDARAMERLEVEILGRLGVGNPYAWAKEQAL